MWSGMVNVGDGGGEDRYIRLRSHNISHRLKAFSGNSFFSIYARAMAKNRNILQLIRICQSRRNIFYWSSLSAIFKNLQGTGRGKGVARVNNQINQINKRLNQIFNVTYSPSRPSSLPFGRRSRLTSRGSRPTSRGTQKSSQLFLNVRRQFKISSEFFLFFVFNRVSGACFHRILVIFQKFVYLTRL